MRLPFDPLAGLVAPVTLAPDLPMRRPTILVFDSGLGGLTVYREVAKARPDARLVYVADDAAFPYGRFDEETLAARVVAVMDRLIVREKPDCVVIACNTASTLVLPHLRARFPMPFVGTVPAIKPACAGSATKRISVLATPGTVARDYTKKLVETYGLGCAVTLVGSARLASLAEAVMRGETVDEATIRAEIAPCFIDQDGGRTDTVVLACTHYPLLVGLFERIAPWPVAWIDPAPAIARRVVQLVGSPRVDEAPAPAFALLTGGGGRDVLAPVFARFGFDATEVEVIPLEQALV